MLKEQLLELQQSKKTILNSSKSHITFIEDDSIDVHTLFNLLQFPSEFTTSKSLNFDRHRLSEKEERKFNKKFLQFLKTLISKMNDPQMPILLEFLLRIYCIDTFNTSELRFLLLPFPKYFKQLVALNSTGNNSLKSMKSYSYHFISDCILKDDYLMVDFIQYCSHYNSLNEFIDKIFDEMIEKVKKNIDSHVNSFYQIIKVLVNSGNINKAIEIYGRLEEIHDVEEISAIFNSYTIPKKITIQSKSENERIFEEKAGRTLLSNVFGLCKYLEYLELSHLQPEEFNTNEFNLLRNVFLNKSYEISDFEDIAALYHEISSKSEIDRYLSQNKVCSVSTREIQVLNNDNFDIKLFTNENHINLIYNLPPEIIELKASEILFKCLEFKSFNPEMFSSYVFNNICSDAIIKKIMCPDFFESDQLVKINILGFMKAINHDISSQLLSHDLANDQTSLSYILSSDQTFKRNDVANLISIAKNYNSPSICTVLIKFICKNQSNLPLNFNLNEFCVWAISNGYVNHLETFMITFSSYIATENHFNYLLLTRSLDSLRALQTRNFNFLPLLYDAEHFNLILEISKHCGFNYILIEHPNVISLIEKYNSKLNDHHSSICQYILDHIEDSRAVPILINYFDQLLHFRSHRSWRTIKIILTEGIATKSHYQSMCDYILGNISSFDENDSDLFQTILSGTPFIDHTVFKMLPYSNVSATFVDIYIANTKEDLLSAVPAIAPLLIDFKKESIEILFGKYQNIMASYSRKIIENFAEKSFVLINLEPKIVLRELCNNLNQNIVKTFTSILTTRTCNSEDILKRLVTCFKANLGTLLSGSDLILLIKFYIRSFNGEHDDLISDLLDTVYSSDRSTFFTVAKSTVDSASSVYIESILNFSDIILSGNSDNLEDEIEFMCEFLEFETAPFENSSALYDAVCDKSPKLASYLIRNDPEILSSKIKILTSQLKKKTNTANVLDTLICIFTHCEESLKYKSKILPYIVVLSEDSNHDISDKAFSLLEKIQN